MEPPLHCLPVVSIVLGLGFAPARTPPQDELRALLRDATAHDAAERRAAWSRLAEHGALPPDLLQDVQEAAVKVARDAERRLLRTQVVGELEALARRRDELDRRRGAALALILDEERYFYPFAIPDVTVERAREYPALQREVEQLVSAVSDIWGEPGVHVPRAPGEAAGDLGVVSRACAQLSLEDPWPVDLPRWLERLAPGESEVRAGDFAWTAEQAAALDYDRRVEEHNESTWSALENSELAAAGARHPEFPLAIERDQVRMTNAYRRMLGVPALTWSPSLQRAARDHSLYMADVGQLTHTQPSARLGTPAARMRAAGYGAGRMENVFYGAGGALAAHHNWLRSSAHHRNLLHPELRAMASAEAGGYWTQDLGTAASFHDRGTPQIHHGTTER